MSDPSFWGDQVRAKKISQELAAQKERIASWEALDREISDAAELSATGDPAFGKEIEASFPALEERINHLEFETFFTGPHDSASALCALHAGTGGVDAMDWTEMLFRMYSRFCETMGWRVRVIDEMRGQEAGLKSITFEVIGTQAYGYLKAEHGVHRLVRISPFDAEKMRQTSFALFEVIPDLGDLGDIEIKPEDIRIDVFRAGGHGGQSVNTTDSAVRITHLATGIVVSCQNERSQVQNRETALRYLKGKLIRLQETQREEEKKALRGAYSEAAWGNQIRSYVLNPYRLVKDHRTHYETQDVQAVLNGNLLPFIESYLRANALHHEPR